MAVRIPESLRQRLKDNRVLFIGISAVLVLLSATYYAVLRGRELDPASINNRVLLFFLRNVNTVLVLIIAFVLIRNLVKLLVERQAGRLGSKFKTKLVATYIGLSLIPVLLLFTYATELFQGKLDSLFRAPVEELLEPGYTVSQELTSSIQTERQRDAEMVLAEIARIDLQDVRQRPRLARALEQQLQTLGVDLLAVYEDTEFIHASLNPLSGVAEIPDLSRSFLLEVVRDGKGVEVDEIVGRPERWILAAEAGSAQATEPRPIVIAGTVLGAALAQKTEALVQAYQGQLRLEVQENDIRAIYLLTFLMVTLVILLTSSWVGLYLARRITVPIEALAEGTRRIMSGDLEHRVAEAADDELGVLVDSFNRMTAELKKNKELLEHSNEELVSSNQKLDEERALIGTVVENVAAGVISIDRQGRVFACNSAAHQMLELDPEELAREPLLDVLRRSGRHDLFKLFEQQLAARAASRQEARITVGGQWKTFEIKSTPLRDDDGTRSGSVIVIEDLTELIRAQKLATWNEAARRIAHEIKNPLTPIKLSAERLLLKHQLGDEAIGDALEQGVATIVREVDNMKNMVDEFARFARMPPPQPQMVELGPLLEDTVKLYRDIKPGIEVSAEVEGGPAAHASVDGEQFRSALINLIDNAVAATSPPGQISVHASRTNGILEVSVRDTGIGIPADAKDKLFLPYYSTKGRGTGLGLAIVHRIVTDHHGTIRVDDNEPQGTIFTIEIPQS